MLFFLRAAVVLVSLHRNGTVCLSRQTETNPCKYLLNATSKPYLGGRNERLADFIKFYSLKTAEMFLIEALERVKLPYASSNKFRLRRLRMAYP